MKLILKELLNNIENYNSKNERNIKLTVEHKSSNCWIAWLNKDGYRVLIACGNGGVEAEKEINHIFGTRGAEIKIDGLNHSTMDFNLLNLDKIFKSKNPIKGKYSWLLDEHKQQLI